MLAISEQLSPDKQRFLAWLTQGRVWEPLSYGRNGQYLPTGAAALPDGDVLVLEHHSSWTGGVASRIARVSLKAVRPGAVLNGNILAVLEPPLVSAKFEGIAARRAADGTTHIYIVSDDNYNSPQGTILLMFALGR